MLYKEIICLADSRKLGGRCIAGKEASPPHGWVRPVSSLKAGELHFDHLCYDMGGFAKVLDIIKIPCRQAKPTPYQPENFEITEERWEHIGKYSIEKIDDLCDYPEILWMNDRRRNDRIPAYYVRDNLDSSLLFIKSEDFKIVREDVIFNSRPKRKLRGEFKYNNVDYDLGITDFNIEREYGSQEEGTYHLPFQKVYLTISLAEPYHYNCYKLIAAAIPV